MTGRITSSRIALLAGVTSVALGLSGGASQSSPPPHPAQSGGSATLTVPAFVNLGMIRVGDTAGAELRIANHSAKPVRIARFESSCPCVSIRPTTIDVPASGEAVATVVFDTSDEPEFRGELAVRLDALDVDASVVFRTRVSIGVSDAQR
jgi:hypothetical protein